MSGFIDANKSLVLTLILVYKNLPDLARFIQKYSVEDPNPHGSASFGKRDPEQHQSKKPDPDPHYSEKSYPDPHTSEKQNPDPHQGNADLQHCRVYHVPVGRAMWAHHLSKIRRLPVPA
jgi:hypothetical protein